MKRDLKMFMRGKSVTMLQNMLKQMGYPMNDVQGVFGACTRDGVKDFQKRKGVKATGVVDGELFTLIQQSVGFQAGEKRSRKEEPTASVPSAEMARLDALIGLLIDKGVISEEEVSEAFQAKVQNKAPGSPLF